MNRAWMTPAACMFVVLMRCGVSDSPSAGGGGEITNGVVAINGTPVVGVTVMAFPVDYVPVEPDRLPAFAVTDSLGQFAFALEPGSYNVVAMDTASRRGAFIAGVGPDTLLDTVPLTPLGSIAGAITRETPNLLPIDVYIPGSPFYTTLALPDTFALRNIPEGNYELVVRTVDTDTCTPGLLCTGREVLHRLDATVLEGSIDSVGVIDITQPP